ncbi:MAG: OmpA family protein [Myxococcota bacterium]
MSRTSMLGMVALLAIGCVPQAKYDQLQKQNQRLRKRVNRMEAVAESRLQTLRDLQQELSPLINRGVLEIRIVDGQIMLELSSDILFQSGSAELSADGKKTLSQIASILSRRSDRKYQVEGHTDDDPIATDQFPNNWYLGAARAIVVSEHMIDKGMSPRQISAATYAAYRPHPSRNDARSRRIELVVVPDLSELPGYEQLVEEAEKARQNN